MAGQRQDLPEEQAGEYPGKVAGIVLAAGSSTRLGYPKQLLEYHGEPLLQRICRLAQMSGYAPIHVVLGAYADLCRQALQGWPVEVVVHENWRRGMGSTLKAAVQELKDRGERGLKGCAVFVCDQIQVDQVHLTNLLYGFWDKSGGKEVVATGYSNQSFGVPVIFPAALFDDLLASSDDRGAKQLLERVGAKVIACPKAELDVDTFEDVQRFGLKSTKRFFKYAECPRLPDK